MRTRAEVSDQFLVHAAAGPMSGLGRESSTVLSNHTTRAERPCLKNLSPAKIQPPGFTVRNPKRFPWKARRNFVRRCNTDVAHALYGQHDNRRRSVMPFLIPVLIGIPVLFGGGYVVYHLVH
jgi:hypothetical protein